MSVHKQPSDYVGVLQKVNELPRRVGTTGAGFDGLGVVILDFDDAVALCRWFAPGQHRGPESHSTTTR